MHAVRSAVIGAVCLLVGCAIPVIEEPQQWAGRLALRAQCLGTDRECSALAGRYRLQGGVDRGELVFHSPFGIVLAALRWDEHGATRQIQGKTRQYDDVQGVVNETLAMGLPWTVLLDWLRGVPAPAAGWDVTGGQYLIARRKEPFIEVRVVPDREAPWVQKGGAP